MDYSWTELKEVPYADGEITCEDCENGFNLVYRFDKPIYFICQTCQGTGKVLVPEPPEE